MNRQINSLPLTQFMEIYITKHGQQIGPFSEEEVRGRLESGNAKGMDLAWCEGRSDWVPLSEILSIESDSFQQPPTCDTPAIADTVDTAIKKQQRIEDDAVIASKNGPPPLPSQRPQKIEQPAPVWSPALNHLAPALVPEKASKGGRSVMPRTPPRSIGWVTFWAFVWPGLGQLLCGQSMKGGVLMLVCLLTCGIASATVIIPLVICILSAVDARKVAIRLAQGKPVGLWAFFPSKNI